MEKLIVIGAGKMGEYVAENILPGMEGNFSEIFFSIMMLSGKGVTFISIIY